jgi:hypothetical protein
VPVQETPGFEANEYTTVVAVEFVIRISAFVVGLNDAPIEHAELTPLSWKEPST